MRGDDDGDDDDDDGEGDDDGNDDVDDDGDEGDDDDNLGSGLGWRGVRFMWAGAIPHPNRPPHSKDTPFLEGSFPWGSFANLFPQKNTDFCNASRALRALFIF